MVHKYSYGSNEAETIEVSNEQIAAGLPVLLQVRRGSESALNQLLPDAATNDANTTDSRRSSTKRWSAAAPISQEPKIFNGRRSDVILTVDNGHNQNWVHSEEDENEKRDIFPPRQVSSGFTRDGSNRLSMQFYGDTSSAYKWADAADRAISNRVFSLSLPREHRKKEPFSPTNSNTTTTLSNDGKYGGGSTEYITLKMDDEALGIHVVPDYDQNGNDRGLLVQRIEPGGKVDRDGRLSVNDRIVEINDRNLINQSFNTVQEIFRDSLRSPELRLRVVKHQSNGGRGVNGVAKKQPPPPIYPKPSINHPKHPLYNKENIAVVESEEKSIGNSCKVATVSPTKKMPVATPTSGNILMAVNTRKIGRKIELELTKGMHGLGFSITTRDNPIGGHCPIYIKNILPKGAAVEDGRLRCGDRLLSVNGVDLTGKTQADAVTELRNVPMNGIVKIVVSRQEDIANGKSSEQGISEVDAGGGSGGGGGGVGSSGINGHNNSTSKQRAIHLDTSSKPNPMMHNGVAANRKNIVANVSLQHHQNRRNSSSSLLNDSSSNGDCYGRTADNDNTAPTSTDNSGNSEQSDNTVIFLPPASKLPHSNKPLPPDIMASRNPVLDRLTGQLPNHNSLRNESYYRATHQTSMMMMGKDNDKLTSPTVNQSPGDLVIIEEDPPYSPSSENSVEVPVSASGQQRGSTTSTQTTDVTYASQLSLDEGGGFYRDAFGRQSMSEKRHATLDAKSTDTYQRNKKLREEREKMKKENRRSTIGVVKVNSTESIPRSDRNEMLAKNQLGPSLGMKKSSSLESLQTMVQEIQMAEDGVYRRTQIPVKVIRGRGCNESFRAAVDRSYEAPSHHVMEPLPEDDGCNFPPRQSSLNSQLDCKLMKQQQNGHKKKSSFLRGLGSMFRFGRHRKPAVLEERGPSSHLGISSKSAEDEEKERAIKAARDEQQRIQEHYKLLIQRQFDMQQQQQQQHQQQHQQQQLQQQQQHQQNNAMTLSRSHTNPTQYIQANNININNNYIPMTNGRMQPPPPQQQQQQQQHRVPQQCNKYVDRRSLFPPETKEEFYNGVLRQSIRIPDMEPTFNSANRASGRYSQTQESNRYSHYVNYEEIQQHLNRKQQHYHSQRRDNRELSHRPVSNFYEYESVQTMMKNQGALSIRPQFLDTNMNPMSVRSEFFPSSVYGSTRIRNCEQRSYPIYQNSNVPYPIQFSPPQTQFFYHSPPLYSNIRPLPKTQGPYVTQVTIRDNHHHYTSNTLGTKV
ncbi:partitioning defective 3 homolog isoform X2 [Planococcus citri]|uniref:partitioning defective 3 homolog isoform X2 n=1 Tax=Planococcus citri TaxID=170843 RepID=UPI0031F9BD21